LIGPGPNLLQDCLEWVSVLVLLCGKIVCCLVCLFLNVYEFVGVGVVVVVVFVVVVVVVVVVVAVNC